MNRKAMAEHLLLLCWPWPCMVASRPHASSCVLAGVLGHHHGPERWATFMAQKSALAQKRAHYHGPEKRGVLGHHHGPEKRLGNTSLLADFRLDPSVLPPPPWWLLPPFSLISASTRLSCQRHLVLEVARLYQPSPLSPWQIPGQARARMQHKHKQARHEQAHSVM